jgi:arylsulfatase
MLVVFGGERSGHLYRPGFVKRPNILLIMTDQQRSDSLGYARKVGSDTPFLDRLAERGVIFDTAYSAAPVCVPARTSLLTGLFDTRLPRGPNGLALKEGCWTVPRALSKLGYETALFGKMHFSPIGANHGFQVVRSCEHLTRSAGYAPEDRDDYRAMLEAHALEDPRGDFKPMQLFPYDERLHPTSWITQEAVEFLKRRTPDRPYFAIVSYTSPHTPIDPPERYASMFEPDLETIPEDRFDSNLALPPIFASAFRGSPGDYYHPQRSAHLPPNEMRRLLAWIRALLRQIDDSVAELMQHVSLDDTVVFFTSDHGDYGGHRGLIGKVPWIPFDDLARVSFFCVGAGVEGGRRVTAPVQSADFALTSLELGGGLPPAPHFDTESLVEILKGGDAPDDRAVFCAFGLGYPMIRKGRYKYFWHATGDRMLFDLEEDPDEVRDIVAQHPKIVEDLGIHLRLQMIRPMLELGT